MEKKSYSNFENGKIKTIAFIFISIFFFVHLKNIKPEYTYALDSFVKLVQTISLKENNFQSEELIYRAKDLDVSQDLYPLSKLSLRNQGKFISPFATSFAFLNALALKIVSWQFLPYLCLITAFLSLVVINQIKPLKLITFIFASLGTPLLFQGLEYSENPLLILLESIGLFFFLQGISPVNRFFTGFFIAIGCWLRLEPLLFLAFFYLSILIVLYKGSIFTFIKNEIFLILGTSIPLLVFFIWNLNLYGHPFGSRFLINQNHLQSFVLLDRFFQVWNLLFLAKMKIGFFGFTPIFLFVFIFFLFPKNKNLLANEEKSLLYTVLFFLPITSIFAPNDGVTNWGARYLNLAIVPGLLLFDSFYSAIKNEISRTVNIIFYIFVSYSIFILFLGFQFQRVASKEIRMLQEDLRNMPGELHIAGAGSIPFYSGGEYLNTKMIEPRKGEQLKLFINNNRNILNTYDKIILSKIKLNPVVQEGIKRGIFPEEKHYEELIEILKKDFLLEKEFDGKRLNLYQFTKNISRKN